MSMIINLPTDLTAQQSEQLVDGVKVTKGILVRRAKVYFGKAINSKRSGIKIVPIDDSNYQIAFTVSKKADEATVGAEIKITKDSFTNDPIAMVQDNYATRELLESGLNEFIDSLKVTDKPSTPSDNASTVDNNASTATTPTDTTKDSTTTDNASTVTVDNTNSSTVTDNSSTVTSDTTTNSSTVVDNSSNASTVDANTDKTNE